MSRERVVIDRMMLMFVMASMFAVGLFIGGCLAVVVLAEGGYLK